MAWSGWDRRVRAQGTCEQEPERQGRQPESPGTPFLTSPTQNRAYGDPSVHPPPWVVMRVPAQALPGQICFDSKPRIISKGTKDSPSVCSNLAAKHSFYNNK